MDASTEKRIERIEDKVDGLSERLNSIDNTLAAQHVSLNEHMRRTQLLEGAIEPLKIRASMVRGALEVFGAMAAVLAVLAAVVEILTYLKGLHV